MAERIGPIRIVPPLGTPPPARRGRPGAAVVLILVYAAAFGAGLLWIRARSPLLRFRGPTGSPDPARAASPAPPKVAPREPDGKSTAPPVQRAELLAGEGLAGAALAAYDKRLSRERCTCGCNLPLRTCLAQDRSCARSPELAEKIRASLR